MKFYFLLFSIVFTCTATAQPALYNGVILADTIPDESYKQALADLQVYLSQISGSRFDLSFSNKPSSSGIIIRLNKGILLSAALQKSLEKAPSEAVALDGNAQRLLIVARTKAGLVNGIYTYLDKLGVKWYLPGDAWVKVSPKKDVRLFINQLSVPSFRLRDFFGTGGIVQQSKLDPSHNAQKSWNDWKRRNRMGSDISLGGHYGEEFNLKYKAVLQSHPEYMAQINGKREWSASAKLCIGNAALRQFYVQDRVAELKGLVQASPASPNYFVSVDPSDGGNDCECNDCKKLGSPADRYYLLANQVAEAFAGISPKASVNMYAYQSRAAVPHFSLRENVMVMIVPYAFQNFASPEAMIAQWQKAHDNLFIYDYYGLVDWQWEQPFTDALAPLELAKKITYWYQNKLQGFLLETAYGGSTAALGLYIAARLGWDVNEPSGPIVQQFYKDMFGDVSADMQLFYEKMSKSFQGQPDLPYLLDQLRKANAAAGNNDVKNRIKQLKAYVHYLKLFYAWRKAPADETNSDGEALYQYALQLYPYPVIHSSRVAQLAVQQLKDQKKWAFYEPVGPGTAAVQTITSNEIEENFKNDLTALPLLEGYEYKKLAVANTAIGVLPNAKNTFANEMTIYKFPETLVKAGADGRISFDVKVNESSSDNLSQNIEIDLIDTATQAVLSVLNRRIDTKWQTVTLTAKPSKTVRLLIHNPNWIRMRCASSQWMAFTNIPTYAVMGTMWFYSHPGQKYLYYSNEKDEQPKFATVEGQVLKVERAPQRELYRVLLPASPQWVRMDGSEYKFLNFHSSVLFFPHTNLLVLK